MSQITEKQSKRGSFLALILFLWLVSIPLSSGAEERNCLTCGEPLKTRAWKYPQGLVCDNCHLLQRKCSICGLPAVGEGIITKDGRTICKREMNQVIRTAAEGKEIFDKVRTQLTWITEDRLKLVTPEVKVRLFDVAPAGAVKMSHNGKVYRTTGMAESIISDKGFDHTVLLLSFQMPDEAHAVAAHEYAHLWINENKAEGRKLENDTEEAFCELVAWKYLNLERDEKQKSEILENEYTNGKIKELIDLEVQYGFNNIIDWVKNGTASKIDEAEIRKFLAPDVSAGFRATSAPKTERVFEALELKGIMFSKKNPMAMINDKTLSLNQSATLEISGVPMKIRCQEIHPDRVVVLLEETGETVELTRAKQ